MQSSLYWLAMWREAARTLSPAISGASRTSRCLAYETPCMERTEIGTRRFWEDLARSRGAALIALAWGFAEASLFFIVPDVWIGLLALFHWRAGLRAAGWAVL